MVLVDASRLGHGTLGDVHSSFRCVCVCIMLSFIIVVKKDSCDAFAGCLERRKGWEGMQSIEAVVT